MFSAMGLAEIIKLSFEIEIGLSRCRINYEERAWEQEFQSYLDPLIWLGLRNLIPRKLQHLSGSCFRYFLPHSTVLLIIHKAFGKYFKVKTAPYSYFIPLTEEDSW